MRHFRFLLERTEPLGTSVFVCKFVFFYSCFLLSAFVYSETVLMKGIYGTFTISFYHILVVRRLVIKFAENHLNCSIYICYVAYVVNNISNNIFIL